MDFVREKVERARSLVPAGEVLRSEHGVDLAERAPSPGRFRRPRVLRSERIALGGWLLLPMTGLLRVVTATLNPFERLVEAFTERDKRKPGKPFHGGWNSMAGHLARGLAPRTKNPANPPSVVMQVTDHRLHIVYVSRVRSLTGEPGPVEAGWATDIRNVAWIRDRSDVMGGDHEIGFVDGSWCTVRFWGDGWRRMSDAFPLRLSHLDPIPNLR
ncbi:MULTISPECIES: hypothetical protein [unclassified Streptomyces]|uniref:hypothetical protein n=1 Tax=unclassified Streptomyces TaxID=2593676 RepID=UPI002366B09C|nr:MULTISPECIES: hypothetical protein [unclassified Streptomyces]MDF3140195.1 hypothetical protein [Streptomyces sp. T21Q-yed]WDF41696.1 hypothetical protein PBV52_35335 [Streptomyces sp. T12]